MILLVLLFYHQHIMVMDIYLETTMGGENRGGLRDLDRKSRSGFFFVPISILHRDRGESRLASTFLELPQKF